MKNIVKIILVTLIIHSNVFAQKNKPIIRFGLIADIQYADCETEGSRFYRNSLTKLEESINYLNNQNVQFTINLGDVIDRNFGDLDSVLLYLNRLKNTIYHTTGNHDYNGITNNTILFDKLNMPSEYYSFKQKDWIFVMLNTNEIATYANISGTEKERELSEMLERIKSSGDPQGAPWNGGISNEQLKWLNTLLAKAEKSDNNVLVFSHHPLYPQTGYTALNNTEILDVISKYSCVKAIFSGHHHSGNFAPYKNIPVITVEGMIETKADNSFGIVEIYNDKIVLQGKGRMSSHLLRYK